MIGNGIIEEVLDYLGSLIENNGDGFKEIKRRLGMATRKLKNMKNYGRGQLNPQNYSFNFPSCKIWCRNLVLKQASGEENKRF